MGDEKGKFKEVDQILNGIFDPTVIANKSKLRALFEGQLIERGITFNQAIENLQIEFKSLNGYLDGTFKKLDIVSLQKISSFIGISLSAAVDYYLNSLNSVHQAEIEDSKKRAFILNNFDLPGLKKMGFIKDSKDFAHIEQTINSFFGFDSIYEYNLEDIKPAFSKGKRKPASELPRDLWVHQAVSYFKKLPNLYEFDRVGLLNYFPTIRWHSMNVEKGLLQVSRSLYKYGVTLMFVDYVPGAHVRGATFAINGKPCIAITNYTDFYPTLWFALIHELHHVLFDWEEISELRYHLSGKDDLFTMKEEEADNFARDYLFSNDKMELIKPNIEDKFFVERFASDNHVHPSIIYSFYAYNHSNDKNVWAKIKKFMPDNSICLKSLINNPWQSAKPIKEICNARKEEIFKF